MSEFGHLDENFLSQNHTPGKSGPHNGSVSTILTTSPNASNALGFPFEQSDPGFPASKILLTSKTADHRKNFEDADSEKILNSIEFEQNFLHDKDTVSDSKGSNYSHEPAQEIGFRNCCLLEAIHWDALYEGRATGWEECMVSAEDSAGKTAKETIIKERDAATTYVSFDPQQHTKQNELVEETRRVYDQFLTGVQSRLREAAAWSFSVRIVESKYISNALRILQRHGVDTYKFLHAPDRARGLTGTNSKGTSDIDSLLLLPAVVQNVDQVEKVKPRFHHINFLGNPTYARSSTPPEVSLWFVTTSRRKRRFPPRSRQGVITSQAAKMIDPYLYFGPNDVFQLSGSALRNAVAGYVRKAYSNNGTWLDDRYTDWRDTPINEQTSDQEHLVFNALSHPSPLQEPHFMSPGDRDVIFNDQLHLLLSTPKKYNGRHSNGFSLRNSSKLKIVQYAAYESYGATTSV